MGNTSKCFVQGNSIMIDGKGSVGEFRSNGDVYYNGKIVDKIEHDSRGDVVCKGNQEIATVSSSGSVDVTGQNYHIANISDDGSVSVIGKGIVGRAHKGTKTQIAVLYILYERLGIKY